MLGVREEDSTLLGVEVQSMKDMHAERPRASVSHGLVQQWDGRSSLHTVGNRAPPRLLPVGRATQWAWGAQGAAGPWDPPYGAAASQGGTSETSYLAAICIFMVPPAVLPDCFTGRKGNRKIYNPLEKMEKKDQTCMVALIQERSL